MWFCLLYKFLTFVVDVLYLENSLISSNIDFIRLLFFLYSTFMHIASIYIVPQLLDILLFITV